MILSDAAITKWELPDLYAHKSARTVRAGAQTKNPATTDYDAGRQAGFEQGRKEGLEAAETEIGEKLNALETVIGNLSAPLAQVDNQIARELIQLSVSLAETIIHREVDLQPELIERQVAEALATLTSKSAEIRIRLHPDDARILEESRTPNSESEGKEYQIVADPNLHRGGCVLQTPTTLVDATIEKQLKDLLSEMLNTAAEQ